MQNTKSCEKKAAGVQLFGAWCDVLLLFRRFLLNMASRRGIIALNLICALLSRSKNCCLRPAVVWAVCLQRPMADTGRLCGEPGRHTSSHDRGESHPRSGAVAATQAATG